MGCFLTHLKKFFFLRYLLNYLTQRKSVHKQGEADRGRNRASEQESQHGAQSKDPGTLTWAKGASLQNPLFTLSISLWQILQIWKIIQILPPSLGSFLLPFLMYCKAIQCFLSSIYSFGSFWYLPFLSSLFSSFGSLKIFRIGVLKLCLLIPLLLLFPDLFNWFFFWLWVHFLTFSHILWFVTELDIDLLSGIYFLYSVLNVEEVSSFWRRQVS